MKARVVDAAVLAIAVVVSASVCLGLAFVLMVSVTFPPTGNQLR